MPRKCLVPFVRIEYTTEGSALRLNIYMLAFYFRLYGGLVVSSELVRLHQIEF